MQEGKRSLAASLAVIGVVLAAAGGHLARRQVEIGPDAAAGTGLLRPGILASNDQRVELSESEYFYQLTQLLEKQYVDPVADDAKLASGAVRGMVGSLIDPNSLHMSAEHFKSFQSQLAGKYEGIGVEIKYEFDKAELKKAQERARDIDSLLLIPDLKISAVMPGSPAERAGIRAGDRITRVSGKYLVSSRDVREIRALQTAVTDGKATPAELEAYRREFVKRADNSIPVNKAREQLTSGIGKSMDIEWERDKTPGKATVESVSTTVPPVVRQADGSYAIRLIKGAAKALKEVDLTKTLTIDLRNSGQGDFNQIRPLLELLVPAGTYGTLATERPGTVRTLVTESGPKTSMPITLLVDSTTRGAAEVFALALNGRRLARLSGGQMGGDRAWIEVISLPDGSGYTLTTAIFRPEIGKDVKVTQAK